MFEGQGTEGRPWIWAKHYPLKLARNASMILFCWPYIRKRHAADERIAIHDHRVAAALPHGRGVRLFNACNTRNSESQMRRHVL